MSELKQEKTQEHKVSDLNPEDKKITNPLELVKMDFSEYLSKLSKDIPSKVSDKLLRLPCIRTPCQGLWILRTLQDMLCPCICTRLCRFSCP